MWGGNWDFSKGSVHVVAVGTQSLAFLLYHNMSRKLWARDKKADASLSMMASILPVRESHSNVARLPFLNLISTLLIYKMGTLLLTLQGVGRITDGTCEWPALWGTQLELSCCWLGGQRTLFKGRYSLSHSQLRLRTWVSCISGCKSLTLAWNRHGPPPSWPQQSHRSPLDSLNSHPSLHLPLSEGPK